MRKNLIILATAASLLCSCSPYKVQVSPDEYNEIKNHLNDDIVANEKSESKTDIELNEKDTIADNDDIDMEYAKPFSLDDAKDADIKSGEWLVHTFDNPSAYMIVPAFVKDWPTQYIDDHISEPSCTYIDSNDSKFGIRISKYDKIPEVFSKLERWPAKPDSNGTRVLEWSYDNQLELRHSETSSGEDYYSANLYMPDGYMYSCTVSGKAEIVDNYRESFMSMAKFMFDSSQKEPPRLTLEDIIERCMKYADTIYAKVDHYNDDGSYVVRCYRYIDYGDGQGTQEENVAVIRVYPYDYSAYDELTGEPIAGLLD